MTEEIKDKTCDTCTLDCIDEENNTCAKWSDVVRDFEYVGTGGVGGKYGKIDD